MEQQEATNQPVIFEPIQEKKIEPNNTLFSVETERKNVLYKMYVSNVMNRLREMDVPSDVDCQRWAWELMQNAKDSIADQVANIKKTKVDIQLFLENDKVIFMHNGLPFTGKAYLALLYKYSDGKENNAESTGRFGTGFLTTHSLSKIVKVEGDVFNIHDDLSDFKGTIFDLGNNIAGFEVTMYRDGSNRDELIKGLERMEEEKKYYIGEPSGWTKYTYILKTKRNHESSELGFENFKINIAQTMLFNTKFGIVQLKYKNGITTTIKQLSTENFGDVDITSFQLQNENTWKRKFIISSIFEHSNELTIRFEQNRNLRLSGCIELTEDNELTFDPKSPCLFCSLPLVGSEKHEMPITLNSDDFEPNTERQGILLKGSDKKQDRDCLSDVGINRLILRRSISVFESIVKHCSEKRYKNLHILTRGLKKTPIVERDFDGDWFKPNVMIPMRNVLKKYPVVFTDDEIGLKKIEDVFIPIYPSNKNEEYKRQFHHFTHVFFGSVPRFEESIEWSERIWKKDLTNLVDVERLLNAFRDCKCDLETKNSFIQFAWNNHRDLLYTIPILINQNDEFIQYTDEFANGSDVQEDAVDLMEELKYQWRKNHLHREITSIQLPLVHDHQFAMGIIKENNHSKKKFILSRYVIEGNEKREKMFKFAKEFFSDEFIKDGQMVECYKASSIDQDLWDATDSELFRDMMSIIEDNGQIDNVEIEDFVEFIEFIRNYYSDPNIFDKRSLIPSKSGIFHKLNQLFEEKGIPQFLLDEANIHLDYDISDQIKNPSFSCVTAPKEFNIFNFMTSINKKLADDGSISDENKLKMSLSILSFIPEEEGELKNYQIHLQEAANAVDLNIPSINSIENQNKLFWEESNSIIIHEIENMIQNCKNSDQFNINYNINIEDYLNKFIDLLHPNKTKLIPNQIGNFCFLSDLSNDINIPEKVKDVFQILGDDLKPILKMTSIDIECPKNESIDTIIGKLNDNLRKVKSGIQRKAASLIIDMLPSESSMVSKQTNIQNLYHKLTNTNAQVITIECSNEAFWNPSNKIIIKYCETLISQSGNLDNLCSKTGISEEQYIEILNTFSSFLNVDENAIIPNYYGEFKTKSDLYIIKQPEGIFDAIKLYLDCDLFEKFIDKRVKIEVAEYTIFETAKIMNIKMNRANDKNNLSLSKAILRYIPDDKQNSENLKNLLNIVNKFDGTDYEPIEIELCEGLYSKIKPIIHNYINKKVEACKNLKSLSYFFPDAIEFLNNNTDILNFNSYKIVPNQEESFKNLSELQQDDGIYDELKQILRDNINLYQILIHKGMKSIHANQTLTNDSILKYINNFAYKDDVSFQMLHILPLNENHSQIQEKLLHLFQHFTNIRNPTKSLDLPSHFWTNTNKHVINYIIELLKRKNNLNDISKNNDEAIEILKSLYEFASPSSKNLRKIKMVPNQLGELLCFDDLYNEQSEIPDKFKDVLEKHFSFDIRKRLQDSRLSIKVEKSLCVDSSDVIDAINSGFKKESNNYSTRSLKITKPVDLKEKSKAFIMFQPKGKETKVHRFIQCYKNLLNLNFEPITLLTSNVTLWDVAIETLTELIIKQLNNDKNIAKSASRISKNENDVVDFINSFTKFASGQQIYPNMLGEYNYPSNIFRPENIDDEILDIMSCINPQKDYRKILAHPRINGTFAKKKINEITTTIDLEIQLIMKDEKRKNDKTVQKGCKDLIMKWMINHPDSSDLFKYIEKNKLNIMIEIIIDKEKRDEWKQIEKTNPNKLFELIMNANAINIKPEVLDDLKDIDINKEDIKTLKKIKRGNNSQTLTTINSLNDSDRQYLNDHPHALTQFIQNQRENEERMREQQRQMERLREQQRQMEIMRQDRERRLREMQNLYTQRNVPTRNYHRPRNQNIRNYTNNIVHVPVYHAPPPPPPRPFMERLNSAITSLLRNIFKKINYNKDNNCYYCSLVEDLEADEYLILPLFESKKNEIDLNQNIIEITADFPDTSIILIVPSENNFKENSFANDIKIITNIGFDINDLNIVETIGEIVSIDNDDFSFKGCDKYYLHVKENYINNHLIHFDHWSNSFKS